MRRRLGIHQKRALLDIVEETFYYMQGNRAMLRRNLDKPGCWRIIAGKLNRMGPMRKEPNGWKKAWCCMKCKVREKYKRIQKSNIDFDDLNGSYYDPQLDRITNEDWRVIKLCNMKPFEVKPVKLMTTHDGINLLEPDVIIKSPPTSDDENYGEYEKEDEDEEIIFTEFPEPIASAFISIQQLADLASNPNPNVTITHQMSNTNEPAAKKMLTSPIKNNIPKLQTPSVSNISKPYDMILSNSPTISKSNEPVATIPEISKPEINSEPFMSEISKQLGTIVKSLQMRSSMERMMISEMRKNNELQKNMIDLLTDIKGRLPPQ